MPKNVMQKGKKIENGAKKGPKWEPQSDQNRKQAEKGNAAQNVVGLSGGPGAGPFWPATLGSADTARARARVRSRQRCARTQARKGIGRPREPSGLAFTTTIARDQQQVKAPEGEKSRIDTQSAKAHPTTEPIRRRVWRADEWS